MIRTPPRPFSELPTNGDPVLLVAGDDDRVDALARDHLVDHPDHLLVAWIAAGADRQSLSDPTTHHQETP